MKFTDGLRIELILLLLCYDRSSHSFQLIKNCALRSELLTVYAGNHRLRLRRCNEFKEMTRPADRRHHVERSSRPHGTWREEYTFAKQVPAPDQSLFDPNCRDLNHANAVMIAMPLKLTSICIGTASEMSSRAKWAMNDKNMPMQKTSSE